MRVLIPLLLIGCVPSFDGQDTPAGADDSDAPDHSDADPQTGTDDEDAPPTAIIVAADTGFIGDALELDGASSADPQGYDIDAWRWDCDDGSSGEGPQFTLTAPDADRVSCSLTVESTSGLTGTADHGIQLSPPDLADWTIMVFINGDNNLESAGLTDVNEMEAAETNSRVHILAQLDRSPGYTREDGDWVGARRFHIEQDDKPNAITSPVAMDLGAVDSGDWEQVYDFVDWGITNYPAEHYALIIWDHGDGWSIANQVRETKGISWDDETGSWISIAGGDLEALMQATQDRLDGERLDLLGMDACLMGSWEIAHQAAPYADVYVASQDYESTDGWAWDTSMADLTANPDMTPAELAESFAVRFHETGDTTLSATDLRELHTLDTAIDDVAQAILREGAQRSVYAPAARNAQDFEWYGGDDRDLGDMLTHFSNNEDGAPVADVSAAALDALGVAVIANYTNGNAVKNAHGLSIYAPTGRDIDEGWLQASWASETAWTDLLTSLADAE